MQADTTQMFLNETKTLKQLFIFFTVSFLGQTVIQILWFIFQEQLLKLKTWAFTCYLLQTFFVVFFECTSVLVILVLHRKSFGSQTQSRSTVSQTSNMQQLEEDAVSEQSLQDNTESRRSESVSKSLNDEIDIDVFQQFEPVKNIEQNVQDTQIYKRPVDRIQSGRQSFRGKLRTGSLL